MRYQYREFGYLQFVALHCRTLAVFSYFYCILNGNVFVWVCSGGRGGTKDEREERKQLTMYPEVIVYS